MKSITEFKELKSDLKMPRKQCHTGTKIYDDSKQMLNVLTPIILDGKLDKAAIAMEWGDIKSTNEFLLTYRSLTEMPKPKEVTTGNTPHQSPCKSDLLVYGDLIGGK